MSNKKQFGVWMDSQHATIVGREDTDEGDFVILDQAKNDGPDRNSSENAFNNQEIALTQKYFKEILKTIQNVDEIHVTGTGKIQEQFVNYLADTAQYKNTVSSLSTSNKMSDEQFLAYITEQFS